MILKIEDASVAVATLQEENVREIYVKIKAVKWHVGSGGINKGQMNQSYVFNLSLVSLKHL